MILDKVKNTIRKYQMFSPGDKVLVGVSGGPDSLTLLYLLKEISEELKISLYVAHLNHKIRGEEAKKDAFFVRKIAQELNAPFFLKSFDVRKLAQKAKLSLESAARQCRYSFFEKLKQKIKADKIALGHTADDQIETMLMWLIRGSGIRGLSSIPSVREEKIVRPLIECWRYEIEKYCQDKNLTSRNDTSNFELNYFRNRIRHELIPFLEKYNPKIKEVLWRSIQIFRDDLDYLEKEAQKKLKSLAQIKKGEISLPLRKFLCLPRNLQRLVIRAAFDKICGTLENLSFLHIEDILKQAKNPCLSRQRRQGEWIVSLPKRFYAFVDNQKLTISSYPHKKTNNLSFRYLLNIPGEVFVKKISLLVKARWQKKLTISEIRKKSSSHKVYLDFDKIKMRKLTIRNRQPGDYFIPLGMEGRKSLKKFFIDQKIPKTRRAKIPLLLAGKSIIWIIGERINGEYKITPKTSKILKLEAIHLS